MSSFPSVLESIDDLNKNQIDLLISLAHRYKELNNSPVNSFEKTPIVATNFLENSTRTKHSFAIAIQKLGAIHLEFNAETSSLKKGESLEETLLTLHYQGVDACVIRTNISHQFHEFKKSPPIKIINGGDGTNEHPTQALLDLFTFKNYFDGVDKLKGKTITIIGDIRHSRVSHSLMKLLPQYGMKIILCGPNNFLPEEKQAEGIVINQNRDEALKDSDLVYMLRIQNERHSQSNSKEPFSLSDYISNYGVHIDTIKKLKITPPIFHPGPCNIGVELDQALVKSNLYMGYEQVVNSIPMRMAILHAILNNNDHNIGKINGEKIKFSAN